MSTHVLVPTVSLLAGFPPWLPYPLLHALSLAVSLSQHLAFSCLLSIHIHVHAPNLALCSSPANSLFLRLFSLRLLPRFFVSVIGSLAYLFWLFLAVALALLLSASCSVFVIAGVLWLRRLSQGASASLPGHKH